MNQLRVLSLTALLLMLASRLPGQTPAQGENWDAQVVACNDGTILFSVARAYRDVGLFTGYRWLVDGWYNVDPGKCKEIGPAESYHNGGFRKDSVTLLAFAFTDSTGTWGAIKIQGGDERLWHPSNQQFCFRPEGAGYYRDGPGGDLPRACDGAQTGYQMIPASFEYSGPLGLPRLGFDAGNELHVKLDSSDRAIPMGKQTSSGGASQGPGTSEDFRAVLTDAIRGPGAPRLRGSLTGGWVEVCVLSAVVKKESWANPQSARAKALKDAIRQFTASHSFGGGGMARFSLEEMRDRFAVKEVKACSDDDDTFGLQGPQE